MYVCMYVSVHQSPRTNIQAYFRVTWRLLFMYTVFLLYFNKFLYIFRIVNYDVYVFVSRQPRSPGFCKLQS